ncbi:hypothetical protein BDW67DRAFT_152815 [Aspergillus spinulosporus]
MHLLMHLNQILLPVTKDSDANRERAMSGGMVEIWGFSCQMMLLLLALYFRKARERKLPGRARHAYSNI